MPRAVARARHSLKIVAVMGFAAALAGVVASACGAQHRISNQETCRGCRLQLRTVVELASSADGSSVRGVPSAVIQDGQRRYWILQAGELPLLFSPRGDFLQSVGRKGRGPGEFSNARWAAALPGDSIAVFDWNERRATLLSADLKAARTIHLPSTTWRWATVAGAWPDRVFASAIISSDPAFGWPLHLFSFRESDAALSRSFGTNGGVMQDQDMLRLGNALFVRPDGHVWAAEHALYRVTLWNPSGEAVDSFSRRPEWFPGPSSLKSGGWEKEPSPRLSAIFADGDRVWVFGEAPAQNWKAAWRNVPRPSGQGPSEMQASLLPDPTLLYDTIVEIIDTKRRRLVHQERIPGIKVVGVLGSNRFAVYTLKDGILPAISIVQLSLVE